jgi:hypothetical protein
MMIHSSVSMSPPKKKLHQMCDEWGLTTGSYPQIYCEVLAEPEKYLLLNFFFPYAAVLYIILISSLT